MMATTSPEFGRGKTIGVLALVVGCFAVLWPKLFHPMFLGSPQQDARTSMEPAYRPTDIGRDYVLEVCRAVAGGRKLASELERRAATFSGACQRSLEANCGVFLSPELAREFYESRKKPRLSVGTALWNLTSCLNAVYGVAPKNLFAEAATEEAVKKEMLERQFRHGERGPYLHPGMMHPGMREKAQIPHGIHHPGDVPPRPADLAGRPSLGGPGQFVPPQRPGGTMGMIMPIYTLGVVVFFVYTVMKIMFKKDQQQEPSKERRLEVLDPEHRRLIQEYESSNQDYVETWQGRNEREETPLKIGRRECDEKDVEIENLRQRLADTEAAMQRMMATISTVSDRLTSTARAADIVLPPHPPPPSAAPAPVVEEEEIREAAAEVPETVVNDDVEPAAEPEPEPVKKPEPEPEVAAEPVGEPKPERTSKPSPTLSKKHIHFSESTQIGVRDVQTAAEFPRRSRSRSKERLLDDANLRALNDEDDDDEAGDGRDVSNIVLDAALRRDTQLLVSEAECRALPLDEQRRDDGSGDGDGEVEDVTPVVLSGKMTISFLGGGGAEGLSVDVPENHHRNFPRNDDDGDGDHLGVGRRKIGGQLAYRREESDPGPPGSGRRKSGGGGGRQRSWAGQKKIRKRRSSTPTSTKSLEEEDGEGGDGDEEGEDAGRPVSGEDPNADASIMDNVPELPDDDGDVEDPDADDATSAGDENLTGRSRLREDCVE